MTRLVILVIRAYQLLLSPLLGPSCRFEPSCSHYAIGCVENHGVLQGAWLSIRRILRCHPWNAGGYDPPPVPKHRHDRREPLNVATARPER